MGNYIYKLLFTDDDNENKRAMTEFHTELLLDEKRKQLERECAYKRMVLLEEENYKKYRYNYGKW